MGVLTPPIQEDLDVPDYSRPAGSGSDYTLDWDSPLTSSSPRCDRGRPPNRSIPEGPGAVRGSAQVGEELSEVVGEQFGFFVGGEMPAAVHPGVAGDVVGAFGPASGWLGEVAREHG